MVLHGRFLAEEDESLVVTAVVITREPRQFTAIDEDVHIKDDGVE